MKNLLNNFHIISSSMNMMIEKYSLKTNKNININNIINESFECLKFYIFRLEYSLDDYKHRKIQWNFQTFRLTILLTIISWLNIAFIIYQYNQPNKFLLKSFKKLSRLFFECQHIDLLLLFIIIILIILEYHWFILIRKILHYKFRPNELFIKYLSKFNNQKLIIENRYLIRFIWIGNLMTKSLNFIMLFIILLSFSFGLCNLWKFFLNNDNNDDDDDITVWKMLLLTIFIINLLLRLIYLLGQLFDAMKFLLFWIELFILQIKLITINCQSLSSSWSKFIQSYDQLYNEISILNQTISGVVFSFETISKSGIILMTIFLSKQNEWNIYNFIILLFFLSTFLSSNGLYLLLARLPYYNQNVCKKLLNLIANSQQRQRRKYSLFNCNRLFYLKQMIKSNLFVQKISTNQFGFTCGQIFFITRYKYLELFLMNFVLVLLFYKKIYLLNVTL